MSERGTPERGDDGRAVSKSAAHHEEIGRAVSHTVETGAFFGSLMAGLLLGWLADHFLDTGPIFIVVGIVAGSVVGFWRMWVVYSRGEHSGH
jgi:F0F1-type ATP synthase assembly protein I